MTTLANCISETSWERQAQIIWAVMPSEHKDALRSALKAILRDPARERDPWRHSWELLSQLHMKRRSEYAYIEAIHIHAAIINSNEQPARFEWRPIRHCTDPTLIVGFSYRATNYHLRHQGRRQQFRSTKALSKDMAHFLRHTVTYNKIDIEDLLLHLRDYCGRDDASSDSVLGIMHMDPARFSAALEGPRIMVWAHSSRRTNMREQPRNPVSADLLQRVMTPAVAPVDLMSMS
jgi:hypothetical protein